MAAADGRDSAHDRCARLLSFEPGPLYVPQPVIGEVAYFVQKHLGAEGEVRVLAEFAAGGLLPVPVEPGDWERIAELVWRYRDMALGTVDASIVAVAERLDITRIATLDRRHFEVVKPRHAESFELVP